MNLDEYLSQPRSMAFICGIPAGAFGKWVDITNYYAGSIGTNKELPGSGILADLHLFGHSPQIVSKALKEISNHITEKLTATQRKGLADYENLSQSTLHNKPEDLILLTEILLSIQ